MARAIFDVGGQREVLLERLIDVTAPTLVVWGALDCVVPVSQAQDAVRRLPAGRLEIVPDCGHLPHVERPEEFVAIMTAFLAEH